MSEAAREYKMRMVVAKTALAVGSMAAGWYGNEMIGSIKFDRVDEGADDPTTTTSLEFNPDLIVNVQPGVVGEAPCGPKIDVAEASKRFEAGDTVVKPSETSAFYDTHPEVEKSKSEFFKDIYGQPFIDWIIKNKPVLQPDLLKAGDNSIARELGARAEFRVLDEDVDVQNHQCVDGKIKRVQNISRLKKNEQIWAYSFTFEELKQMDKEGVEVPQKAVLVHDNDPKIGAVMGTERGPCVNPITERDKPKEPTTTSSDTTIPTEETIPPSTTSTFPNKNPQTPVPGAGGPSTTISEEETEEGPAHPEISTTSSTTTTTRPGDTTTTTVRAGDGTTTTTKSDGCDPNDPNDNCNF